MYYLCIAKTKGSKTAQNQGRKCYYKVGRTGIIDPKCVCVGQTGGEGKWNRFGWQSNERERKEVSVRIYCCCCCLRSFVRWLGEKLEVMSLTLRKVESVAWVTTTNTFSHIVWQLCKRLVIKKHKNFFPVSNKIFNYLISFKHFGFGAFWVCRVYDPWSKK